MRDGPSVDRELNLFDSRLIKTKFDNTILFSFIFSIVLHGFIGFLFLKDSKDSLFSGSAVHVEVLASGSNETLSAEAPDPVKGGGHAAQGSSGSRPVAIMGSSLGLPVEYPRLSRIFGEEGRVRVDVIRDKTQQADAVVGIGFSSGFSRLDESAMSAVKKALAQRLLDSYWENGNRLEVTFIFKLGDSEIR